MSGMVRAFRGDPVRELEEIGERFSRIFGRAPMRRESDREAMTVADWMPAVDIIEDDKEYLIKAEIPEVDKKNVRVTVQNNVLTIHGERKKESEEKKRYHRVEWSYGTFVRSFHAPGGCGGGE